MTLLGKQSTRREIAAGNVVVDLFSEANLGSAQYDVTLGRHFWRDTVPYHRDHRNSLGGGLGVAQLFNPYSEDDVARRFQRGETWKLCQDASGQLLVDDGRPHPEEVRTRLHGIGLEDVIVIFPGESLLCHTEEFIGGRNTVTTSMRARSSLGRIGISVCQCAGLGDVGYFSRWTMEVRNHSGYAIPLVVGRRVAQLQFWRVEDLVDEADQYAAGGKYQETGDLDKLRASWRPEDMLPKMWRDREVRS